jgi:hypothetical protein
MFHVCSIEKIRKDGDMEEVHEERDIHQQFESDIEQQFKSDVQQQSDQVTN